MQIVIDIPKETFKNVKKTVISDEIYDKLVEACRNGKRIRLLSDGTLIIPVNDYYAVKRVLVEDPKHNGGMFYADSD